MKNGKLLIVDDDPGIRKVLSLKLAGLGYETLEAENGRTALQLTERESFDTILCDVNMPVMDGLEVVSRLKEQGSIVPVIMLTGLHDLEIAVGVMKKGAYDYLTKPIHGESLFLSVEKAVEYKRVLERNKQLENETRQHHEQLKQQVAEQTRMIRSMFDLANRLNSMKTTQLVLDSVLSTVIRFIPSKRVSLMLLENDESDLYVARSKGVAPEIEERAKFPVRDEIWQELFAKGEVRILNEPDSSILRDRMEELQGLLSVPLLQAPLKGARGNVGIINVCEKEDRLPFSDQEAEVLSYIADSATVAINNQLFEERLEDSYLSTIKALAMAVEAKDPYTRGHSERVAGLSITIARRLSLSEHELRIIRFAGILHDVGKIGISERILTKPSRLTDAEFDKIKEHPVIGEKMIREADFLKDARPIIRHHHERVDGTGYPDRLSGKEICLGARIMAVADSFDAMFSDRTYRKAMTVGEILTEIERCSGSQFDPDCVQALLAEFRDLGHRSPLDVMRRHTGEKWTGRRLLHSSLDLDTVP